MVKIGMRARDRVTGYTGLVVAKTQYLEDSDCVCLEGKIEGGQRRLLWFNEARIDPLKFETETTRGTAVGSDAVPRVDVPPITFAGELETERPAVPPVGSYLDPIDGKLREVLTRTLQELGFDIVPIKRGERRPFAK